MLPTRRTPTASFRSAVSTHARPPAGQSASVTACLAKRDDPAKFVEFLRRSLDYGYDQALREVYHLDNIAQLERHWQEQRLAWNRGYHGVRLALDERRQQENTDRTDAADFRRSAE